MHRPTPESPEEQPDAPVIRTLDGRLAELLSAIEEERVPDRLLGLARQLQEELVRFRRLRTPN